MRANITTRAGVQVLWAVIATCAVVGVALSASSRRIEAAVTLDPQEQAALTQLNVERTSRGLTALKVSPALQAASEWMANDMIGNSTATSLSHTDSLGRDIRPRFSSFGYTANSSIRENIAAGQKTGLEVMQGWMWPGRRERQQQLTGQPSWQTVERLQSGHSGSLIRWRRATPAPEVP